MGGWKAQPFPARRIVWRRKYSPRMDEMQTPPMVANRLTFRFVFELLLLLYNSASVSHSIALQMLKIKAKYYGVQLIVRVKVNS